MCGLFISSISILGRFKYMYPILNYGRMKRNSFLAIIIILMSIVVSGCSRHKGGDSVSEPEDYSSITDTVEVVSNVCKQTILSPMRMFVSGNHLVVASNVKTGHVFNVYSLPLGGDEYSGVNLGRGPGELIRPDFNSMVGVKEGFMVADADDCVKFFRIGSGGIEQSGSERIFDPGPLNGVIRLGDAYLNYNFDRQEHPYEFVALKTDGSRDYLGEVPDWDKNIGSNSAEAISEYMNMHVSRPKNDRIAEFYCWYRKVRILDAGGNVLHETSINYPTPSDRQGYYCTYGMAPCASNTRIVALAENAFRIVDPKDVVKPKDYSEFQVWDWEGHLLKRIITKTIITKYTVDFSTGILYGLNPDNENVIYTVDIMRYLK